MQPHHSDHSDSDPEEASDHLPQLLATTRRIFNKHCPEIIGIYDAHHERVARATQEADLLRAILAAGAPPDELVEAIGSPPTVPLRLVRFVLNGKPGQVFVRPSGYADPDRVQAVWKQIIVLNLRKVA